MQPQRPLPPRVKNATDRDQIKAAERAEARKAEQVRAAFATVMATEAGRRVMWELLERAGIYESVWTMTAEIHYRAGRQDYGHQLQATLLEVSEEHYDLMTREARLRARTERNEIEAQHTARASEGETDHGR